MGVAVTNLRFVCKTITCASAFTEMAISFFLEISKSCCRSGYSALQATRKMPLWALAISLSTNTRLFGVLDQNETKFFTYLSQCAESKAATVMSRQAISGGSFTVAGGSSSFVSKVLGANCKRGNNFNPVADKFAM